LALFAAPILLIEPARAQNKAAGTPGAAKAAPEQSGANVNQKAPGWTVTCADSGEGMACKAMQTIIVAKTRQRLLQISVRRADDSGAMALLFHLPHGIFNPAGVTTTVDGAAGETLDIQTCDAQGCYAASSMPPAKFASLLKGASLAVTFQDLNKKKVTVPVTLKGLDEAAKKL